jgi:hypothetical protein
MYLRPQIKYFNSYFKYLNVSKMYIMYNASCNKDAI